jgi:hypothetical protein
MRGAFMKAKTITTSNTAVLVISILLIAACGTQLSAQLRATPVGNYLSAPPPEGVRLAVGSAPFEIQFMSGNKAHYRDPARSQNMEVDYEVRGRQVMIKYPQGTVVATIGDDGCLDGGDEAGLYGKLCKDPFDLGTAPDRRVCAPSIPATTTSSYVKEMPDPARVLADFQGSDSLDTAARQVAALRMFAYIVISFAHQESSPFKLTPDESKLFGQYTGADKDITPAAYRTAVNQQQSDGNSPRAKWDQLVLRFYRSGTFGQVQHYLSPCNRDRFLGVVRARREGSKS